MLQKIADNSNLMRDSASNAIINVDQIGFQNYIQSRNRMDSQKDRIATLDNQVEILKLEMENIKKLLSGFIN